MMRSRIGTCAARIAVVATVAMLAACSGSPTTPVVQGYAPLPGGALASSASSLAIGGGTTSATFTVSEPGSTAPLSASIACTPTAGIAAISPATATPSSAQGVVAFTVTATGAPGTCTISVANGGKIGLSIPVTLTARNTVTVSTTTLAANAGDAAASFTASEPAYAGTFFAKSSCDPSIGLVSPSAANPTGPGAAVTFHFTPALPGTCTLTITDANGSAAQVAATIGVPPAMLFPNGTFASPQASNAGGATTTIDSWTSSQVDAYALDGSATSFPNGVPTGTPSAPPGTQVAYQGFQALGGTGGMLTLAAHVPTVPNATYVITFMAAAQDPGDSISVTVGTQAPIVIPITTTGFATYATPPVVPGTSFDGLTFTLNGSNPNTGVGSTSVFTDVMYQRTF